MVRGKQHMDAGQVIEKAALAKPSPQEVLCMQKIFPRLDYLMCETLLMQTEDQLKAYLDSP